jgi:hypothetical protein
MIDKQEFLSKFDTTVGEYAYMIEREIVIDSRPPYINCQIKQTRDVDDLYRLYEDIKLTHKIGENIRDLPRFKLKGEK